MKKVFFKDKKLSEKKKKKLLKYEEIIKTWKHELHCNQLNLIKEIELVLNSEINLIRDAYNKTVKENSFRKKNYDKFFLDFENFLIEKIFTSLENLQNFYKKSKFLIDEFDEDLTEHESIFSDINSIKHQSKYLPTITVSEKFITLFDDYYNVFIGLEYSGYKNFDDWLEAVNQGHLKASIDGVLFSDPIKYIEDKFYEIESEISYSPEMEPAEYEKFCAVQFSEHGWEAEVTQQSSDQGVDVIAKKNNLILVAQCKRFAKPVGNKAVQEIVAGINFYNANLGVVIAPNGFTNAAEKLAKANKIKLIHHSQIENL